MMRICGDNWCREVVGVDVIASIQLTNQGYVDRTISKFVGIIT